MAAAEGAVARLVQAVTSADAQAYQGLLKEFQLEPFCIQLCHWICFETCRLFCICVCPAQEVIPLFTKVGEYRVDPIWGDFTAEGTTTAGGYAFTSEIRSSASSPAAIRRPPSSTGSRSRNTRWVAALRL